MDTGGYAQFSGVSVAVSGDTALIGAYWNDDAGSDSGSVYVSIRYGAGWWRQQARLTASDATEGDRFGYSVAVSGDTAVIGAPQPWNGRPGSAYAFVRSGGVWTQQAKLLAPDGVEDDEFGFSVAVSGDTAIIGVPRAWRSEPGSAYAFVRSGGIWTKQAELVTQDGAANDNFGCSVAVSGDTAVIGAYHDNVAGNHSGSAYIFTRDGSGSWAQQAKLTASDAAAFDWFGHSVAVSGDTVVVGAMGDDDVGSASGLVYVFTRDVSGSWEQQAKLTAWDAARGDNFGGSVAVSGETAVIGAHLNDDVGDNSGSAYVVDLSSCWPACDAGQCDIGGHCVDDVQGHPTNPCLWCDVDNNRNGWSNYNGNACDDGLFCNGTDICIDGICAHSGDPCPPGKICDETIDFCAGCEPEELAKLTASDPAGSAMLGTSVAVSGDTAVIGAYHDDVAGRDSGSAYIFTSDGSGSWTEQAKLTASDGAEYDAFGRSVAVSGDTAVIGAYHDDVAGRDSGSAYVFTSDGSGSWTQQGKLTASDAASSDNFGDSVAISGDTVVIGALG